MSTESGGDGYVKVKKSSQTGGASGWAKHCGDTDDHQRSNRLERRSAKQELAGPSSEHVRRSLKKAKNRPGKPTRRHLLDRLAPIEKRIKEEVSWLQDHEPEMRVAPPGAKWKYHCTFRSGLRSLARYLEERNKVRAEFTKHGYKLP